MKEDKNWNKMVVLPPVNSGLALPLIASKFSLIANQQPTRKPFPWKLPKRRTLSPNHAARLLLASFSPKRSRSKPFSTIPSTCRNNQQQRQWRSVGFEPECPRASYSRHERERESKLPLDLLRLVLSELIALANSATCSILGRNTGT